MSFNIPYTTLMVQHFYEIAPLHGPIKELVIILHGYGASGDNIIGLAHFWKDFLPHTLFVAPDAPTPWPSMQGFEWFPLPDLTEHTLKKGCQQAMPTVHQLVRDLQQKHQVGWEQTTLVGFSQGAMLVLGTALTHPDTCSKVLAYAGGLFVDSTHITTKPEDVQILLIHGTLDTVVPPQASTVTKTILEEKGFTPRLHFIPQLDHCIDEEGLRLGARFLQEKKE